MICHKMGFSPISIIGFGRKWLSSEIRVPNPPAKRTAFIVLTSFDQYSRRMSQDIKADRL